MKAVAINTLRFRVNGKRVEVPAGRKVELSKEQYDEFFALGAVAPVGDEAANAVIDATAGDKPKAKPAAKPKAEKPKVAEKTAPESAPEDAGDDDADDGDDEEV